MSKKISIVTPAYNEAPNLPLLCERIHRVFEKTNYTYEIVIADNGSKDNTKEVLASLKDKYSIKHVLLTKNFGHQGGIIAGLEHASGDAVVTMDADLQHPPEIISQMLVEWEKGFKVVNSEKSVNSSSFLRKIIDKTFYYLMDHMAGLELGQADFRLIDREVVTNLNALPETEKFIRGLVSWLGFSTSTIKYEVGERAFGVSKYKSAHLWDFALLGLTSFSVAPLRLLLRAGVLIMIPSLFYLIYIFSLVMVNAFSSEVFKLPPGWATISMTIVFFGSVQLFSIGILGEYIGRIYSEVKKRPKYIVKEED